MKKVLKYIIHKLNYNQIMFFTKINDYNSMILGVYDYQRIFSMRDVDKEEIKMLKNSLFLNSILINEIHMQNSLY